MAKSNSTAPVGEQRNGSGRDPDTLADEARRVFRAAMIRNDFSFRALAEAMNSRGEGPTESPQTLINKVNRGRFSFAFLMRAYRAMGMTSADFGKGELDEQ